MKKAFIGMCLFAALAAVTGCEDDNADGEAVDKEKPEILYADSGEDISNPGNCQQYGVGDTIPFRYTFTDNAGLGNINIEIHNNFDHHSHGTTMVDCQLDPKKDPVNPWIYNQDYAVPAGLKRYRAAIDIPIPKDIDPGDYHFMIRVTDINAWQQIRAVSIKVVK